jgi:hypothetical protein
MISNNMNGLASLLEEAENIVLGVKPQGNNQLLFDSEPNIFQGPLRFGRPIMEPLDSCLEPTPLAPSTSLKFKAPRSYFSMQRQQQQQIMTSLSPLKWSLSEPVSLQQEQVRSLMDLSFSSIIDMDDTPLSLEEAEDLDPAPTVVPSSTQQPQEVTSISCNSDVVPPPPVITPVMENTNKSSAKKDAVRARKYKDDLWYHRYDELLKFRDGHGHVMVPHSYPPNQKLAQWVKR